MNDHPQQQEELNEIDSSELPSQETMPAGKAPREFHHPTPGLASFTGRPRGLLSITDPAGIPAQLLREFFEGSGIRVDVMPVYYDDDLQEVFLRLATGVYDLLIPSNLELTPWYIPKLVTWSRDHCPAIKILVISGWGPQDFVDELKSRGMDEFVGVPMDKEDLHKRIKRLLPGFWDLKGSGDDIP